MRSNALRFFFPPNNEPGAWALDSLLPSKKSGALDSLLLQKKKSLSPPQRLQLHISAFFYFDWFIYFTSLLLYYFTTDAFATAIAEESDEEAALRDLFGDDSAGIYIDMCVILFMYMYIHIYIYILEAYNIL